MAGGQSGRDQINVRLSDDAVAILYALQDHFGISQAALFEMMLREKARAERLNVNELVHQARGTSRKTKERKAAAASDRRPGTWGHSRGSDKRDGK